MHGAIKLARYNASLASRPTAGLVIDPAVRLGPFAEVSLARRGPDRVCPGPHQGLPLPPVLRRRGAGGEGDIGVATTAPSPPTPLPRVRGRGEETSRYGFVVLVATAEDILDDHADLVSHVVQQDAGLVITCVDRSSLSNLRRVSSGIAKQWKPDIVVFDESFANNEVPFGAFAARKPLYDHWNRPGKTTFHSTTFQPNTISSLHFLKCLEKEDPDFHARMAPELERIRADPMVREALFRRLYSASLSKAARMAGFDTPNVRARGDYCVCGRPKDLRRSRRRRL